MTELGPIPEDWEVKRLGDVVETSSGGTPSRARPDFFQGTIKWFTTTELLDNKLYDSLEHISHEALKNSSAKIFPPKTLLMAMYGATIGRLGILQNHASTNQACCAIFCGDTLFSDYAYYYLYHLRPNIIERGCGAGQPNISQEIVRSLPVVLPPLAEQRRIAKALSDVDELISALGKLIEKKRNIKTGAMQELLGMRNEEGGMRNVPRRRLAGFSGEWVEKRLGDCGTAIRGVSYKPYQAFYESGTGRTMLLRSNNIQDNVLTFDDVVYVSEECIGDEQYMRYDDILICAANGSRNLVGKSAVLKTMGQTVTFGAFMAIFRANSDIDAGFVGYLFQTESYRKQLDDILTGSAINNLNSKDILDLAFAVPPTLAEQQAIAAVLSDMDAEIAALEAKRAKYESIKQGMMQELLTGKTRLKGECE